MLAIFRKNPYGNPAFPVDLDAFPPDSREIPSVPMESWVELYGFHMGIPRFRVTPLRIRPETLAICAFCGRLHG
jgi:hypothetical protein